MWYKLFVFPQNGHRLTVDASLALFCGNFFYVRTANTNLHYLTPFCVFIMMTDPDLMYAAILIST